MKAAISKILSAENKRWCSVFFLLFLNINFFFKYFPSYPIIFITLFSAYYIFSKERFIFSIFFWSVISLVLLQNIMSGFYSVGNHIFVSLYISLAFLLQSIFRKDNSLFAKNCKYLLFLILLLSVVQKLLSPNYLSGEIMNFYFVSGYFFKPLEYFGSYGTYIHNNQILIDNIMFSDQKPGNFPLYFAHQKLFFLVFSYAVIVAEIILAFLVLSKNIILKNILFIVFLMILLITRIESGFIVLLSILMMSNLPMQNTMLKKIYIGIIIFNLLLIITGIGFY